MEAKSVKVIFTMKLAKGVSLQGMMEIDRDDKMSFAQAEKIVTEILNKIGKDYEIEYIAAQSPKYNLMQQ